MTEVDIPKATSVIPIKDLVAEIRMGAQELARKIGKERDIDEGEEELLGVDNIIKTVEPERRLEVLIAEKDEALAEKDASLSKLKAETDAEIAELKQKLESLSSAKD